MKFKRGDLCKVIRSINEFFSDENGNRTQQIGYAHIEGGTICEVMGPYLDSDDLIIVWFPTRNHFSVTLDDRIQKISK